MHSFLDDLGRGLNVLKAHPDFIAIALLALVLGVARNTGISSAVSLRTAFAGPPAIENFVPDMPAKLDLRVWKPLPRCERNFVVLRSY